MSRTNMKMAILFDNLWYVLHTEPFWSEDFSERFKRYYRWRLKGGK